MSSTQAAQGHRQGTGQYEIRIQGHLADRWSAWFDGLTLTREQRRPPEPARPSRREAVMTITPVQLTRTAGLAAITAGALFILIQFLHPHEVAANVATTRWALTHYLSMLMATLALIGITGMYLRQVQRTGLLGLIAYLLFAFNFLAVTAWTFLEALVLPLLVPQVPAFVNDVIGIPGGGTVLGDAGHLKTVNLLAGIGYLLGGLLFGIAMYRSGILARWAAVLLSAGTAATVLIPFIPHLAARLTAVPVGVALAGLGWSLRRTAGTEPAGGPVTHSPLGPAAVR